jgi:hypothetical protein
VDDKVVRLGEQSQQSLNLICQLRDRMAEGVIMKWRGELLELIDVTALCHLPPPSGKGRAVDEWRSRFRPGLCYFRKGPGFIQIKDVRDPAASASLILDDRPLIDAFTRCLCPTPLAALEPAEKASVDALRAEGLLLQIDDHVTTLPYRMSQWPVPATPV